MHRQSKLISVALVFVMWFGMALKCGSDNGGGSSTSGKGSSPSSSRSSSNGFEDGHKLKGRYSNSDQGIRSFTFDTDGTFQRGGAVSGTTRSGEYSAGSSDPGTYRLSGKTLSVEYEDGRTENLSIDIPTDPSDADYTQESPTRLRINNVFYTHVTSY